MRFLIVALFCALSYAQTAGEMALREVMAHQANGYSPMHELLDLPVLKELSQTKEAQRARRALQELHEIDIGELPIGGLGSWLSGKWEELKKDGAELVSTVEAKAKEAATKINGILKDAETKAKLLDLVEKMKEYAVSQIQQLATNILDALKSLGTVLVDFGKGVVGAAQFLKDIKDGKKKLDDEAVKTQLADAISKTVMSTIATVQSALGLVGMNPPIGVFGYGVSGDINFIGGAGWSLSGFMQLPSFDGKELSLPFAVVPSFSIGAGAVVSASASAPITFSWNTAPKDQGGFGLGVDFGVNVGGGVILSLGWAWDTTTNKLKLATIAVAPATGLGGGAKVYGTYTHILYENTLKIKMPTVKQVNKAAKALTDNIAALAKATHSDKVKKAESAVADWDYPRALPKEDFVAAAAAHGFSDFTIKATVGGIIVAGIILGLFFVSTLYSQKKAQTYALLEDDLEF